MASWEMQLVSRIIREGKLQEVVDWGVSIEDFLSDEGRQIFSHLSGYLMHPETHGAHVGPEAARIHYPNFVFCDDHSMTLPALCREVRLQRLRIDAKAAAQRIADLADSDPIEAAARGSAALREMQELGFGSQSDVLFKRATSDILTRMELLESGVDLSKIHWPWEIINRITMGVTDEDYIVLYGRPKSMKSWVLAYWIAHCWNAGKRPLIYTKEMSPNNIFMRTAAAIASLPYQELRQANLTPDERSRFVDLVNFVRDMQTSDDMVCLSGRDAPGGNDTVEWLRAKVDKYRPDAIFIDGLYLMKDAQGPRKQKDNFRVQSISRAIRQMIFDTKTPVIATFQANRDAAKHQGAELDEIAFSDSIGQDATIAMRVINDPNSPTITLVMGGSREFSFPGLRIYGEPATNFSFHSELSEKDINKAKQKDVEAEEIVKKAADKKKRREMDRLTESALKRRLKEI